MPKNRIIYQSEAIWAGKCPATGEQYASAARTFNMNQLQRVQSINYGDTISRRDVNQFGELAAIDRVILETPVVNLDITYLNQSFLNESYLGFYVNSGQGDRSCIAFLLDKTEDERNYYIKTVPEGVDAIRNTTSDNSVHLINVGNGFISNFNTEGAVGDFPRTTITVEGLNISYEKSIGTPSGVLGTTGFQPTGGVMCFNPAVNPVDGTKVTGWAAIPSGLSNHLGVATGAYAVSVLRPGDITLEFKAAGTETDLNEGGPTFSDSKIQSYALSFSLARDPLQKLGSKFAFARETVFPVQIQLRVDANVGDITTGNVADMIAADRDYDCRIRIKTPIRHALGHFPDQMVYTLKGAKLESRSFTSSIGPNKAVSMVFTAQIGGPLQTDKGLFFSGIAGTTNR